MPSSLPSSNNNAAVDLTEEMLRMSVDRLNSIHPIWRQFILTLNDLPVSRRFDILDGESRQQLHEWLVSTQGEQDVLDPQDPLLEQKLYVRSYVHLQRGSYELARQSSTCLLEYDAQDACYQLFRGLAEFGLGNYQKALLHLDLAVYHEPEHPLANALVGLIAAFTRDHVKAFRSARQALVGRQQIQSWRGTPWLELALFQSEHLLFGLSSSGGLDSGLFSEVSVQPHLEKLSCALPPAYEYLEFVGSEKKEVLFVSCDSKYFYQYALPLALSLADCCSPLSLHLHLINPDDDAFELLQRLSDTLGGNLRATYERVEIERLCHPLVYYSCMRFCRMAQFKLTSIHDYAIIDADMLINRGFSFADVRNSASQNADCILTYSRNEPIWDCLLAGFCLFGAGADHILAGISEFILQSIQQQKCRWFLDQVALFLAAQQASEESVGYLAPEAFCDLEHKQDSYIWAVTTEKNAEAFTQRADALMSRFLYSPSLA